MRGKVLFVVINTFTKNYTAMYPGGATSNCSSRLPAHHWSVKRLSERPSSDRFARVIYFLELR